MLNQVFAKSKGEVEAEKSATILKVNFPPLSVPNRHHRIAHIPKKSQSPPDCEQRQATKRGSCSTSDTTIASKSPKYSLDVLLTPPSVSVADDTEPVNYTSKIIQAIISWDASKIMDKTYNNKPFMNTVRSVPRMYFENFNIYERYVCIQSSVILILVLLFPLKIGVERSFQYCMFMMNLNERIFHISDSEVSYQFVVKLISFNMFNFLYLLDFL